MRTCNAESQKMSAKGSSTSYYSMTGHHRISIARKEKGWGLRFFPQIEPNWPLRYSNVPVG